MKDPAQIKAAFERNARALQLRPSRGQGTAVTRVRVREGLTCEVVEGPWRLTVDLAEKSGGSGAGPNPGVLGRAALGSCLAIEYIRWAALLGVPLSDLSVEVQADYDARGQYGVGSVDPGYAEIRYIITVESDAPEADILRVLDAADAHSPYLHVFRRPQTLRRTVQLAPLVNNEDK